MKKESLFLLAILISVASFSQSSIGLLGPAGAGGPSGIGPVTSNQTVTFYSSTITPASPAITATYSLTNQQFSFIEGNFVSGVQFGGDESDYNSPVPGINIYNFMNNIGSSVNSNYTSCNTCTPGTGINVATNRSIEISSYTDALITWSGAQLYGLNARVQFADLTISFSQPVSNPLLHITGLGGYNGYTTILGGVDTNYDLGFSTDLDLLTSGLTLSRVSGSTYFSVTPSGISNSASKLGATTTGEVLDGITRYGASGTVAVLGTNITSITFRLYVRGDGGIVVNDFGTPVPATNGNIVRWAFQSGFVPGGGTEVLEGISADAILVGISLSQPVAVSGNVFNDPDAGNVNNSTGSTNTVPSGLYANLIDANGKTVASTAVNTDGTYNFAAVFAGTYTMNISTAAGTQGTTAVAAATPANWYFTGEYIGAPNTGNDGNTSGTSKTFTVASAGITNVNFGIQRAPETAVNLQPAQTNPGGFITKTVPAAAFQTSNTGSSNTLDYDGGTVTKIRFTSFPTSCNSITLNGTTYTNGTTCPPATPCVNWPAGGVLVNYTSGTGPSSPVLIDPVDGVVNVVIPFAAVDNAGKEDPTPGKVTLIFGSVLAVNLKSFSAQQEAPNVLLSWEMADENSIASYEAQFSTDGISFTPIGTISPNNSMQYTLIHKYPVSGINYYRLKITEKDGSITYTGKVKVNLGAAQNISVYPNPAKNVVTITLPQSMNDKGSLIQLMSFDGKVLLQQKITQFSAQQKLDVSSLPVGKYILQIKSATDIAIKMIEIIR